MALISFQVPYVVGWCGKTYQVGLQLIPEELAMALGLSPDKTETEEASEIKAGSKRTPIK